MAETRNRQLADIPSSTLKLNNDIPSVKFDLNGKWMIEEIYEFGSTSGDVQIEQNGSHLSGVMSIRDSTDDGETFIIQQHFSGTIRETTVFLYGESISTIGNMTDDYELDQWVGIIKDNNTIEGNSEDLDGTSGEFIMKRLT